MRILIAVVVAFFAGGFVFTHPDRMRMYWAQIADWAETKLKGAR